MRYLLLFCCTVVMACNNQGPGATVNDSTSADTPVMVHADTAAAIVTPSCYALQTSNNLILLQLNTVRPTVSGHLTYDIMGKDKNDGTISGILRGDTLLADYNFISGGKHFVRQVAFLRKGDAFVEGYGDLKQQGDRTVFANTDTLDFNGAMILEKVPCTR